MLMLLFQVGDDHYALEAQQVVEVIPLVKLRTLHQAPTAIAGLFYYQDKIVPVLDLGEKLGGRACKPLLSTRIALVRTVRGEDTSPLLGLMAENVVETLQSTEADQTDLAIPMTTAPYLGTLLMHQQTLIQRLHVDQLLSHQDYARLIALPEEKEDRGGSGTRQGTT